MRFFLNWIAISVSEIIHQLIQGEPENTLPKQNWKNEKINKQKKKKKKKP